MGGYEWALLVVGFVAGAVCMLVTIIVVATAQLQREQ